METIDGLDMREGATLATLIVVTPEGIEPREGLPYGADARRMRWEPCEVRTGESWGLSLPVVLRHLQRAAVLLDCAPLIVGPRLYVSRPKGHGGNTVWAGGCLARLPNGVSMAPCVSIGYPNNPVWTAYHEIYHYLYDDDEAKADAFADRMSGFARR